jgi:hypothetical protein
MREYHAGFCESGGVRFLSATRPGSMQMRDNYPMAMRSRFSMSGVNLRQRPMSPTACRQVWSGFAMDGSALIISHRAMRF